MSRRKKKLYARKYQPWYAKKAAIAQTMEEVLKLPIHTPIGGLPTMRTGVAGTTSTAGTKLVLDSASAAATTKLIYTLEERLGCVKEGMKRWHKAVRRIDSRRAGGRTKRS